MIVGFFLMSFGKAGAASPSLGNSCTGTRLAGRIEYKSSILEMLLRNGQTIADIFCQDRDSLSRSSVAIRSLWSRGVFFHIIRLDHYNHD